MVYEREGERMISSVKWLEPPRRNKSKTVNERIDCFITITRQKKHGQYFLEYLVIRIFGAKFEQLFKDVNALNVGFIGKYIILEASKAGGFTVYKNFANPEIRIRVDTLLAQDRDPTELEGSYLIHWDASAKQAYIDLTRKATV